MEEVSVKKECQEGRFTSNGSNCEKGKFKRFVDLGSDMDNISVKEEFEDTPCGDDLSDSLVQSATNTKSEEKILKTNNHQFEEILIKEEPDSDNLIAENCNEEKNSVISNKKKKRCPVCGKFIQQCNLSKHLRYIHKGIKNYHCDVCNKSFTERASWKYHMTTHTGQKDKFECSICNKTYTKKSGLRKHLYNHTTTCSNPNKERIQCSICSKFLQRNCLAKHLKRTHNGIKAYRCNVCNKSFTESASLKYHVKIHTGKRDKFECSICNKSYTKKSDLARHFNTHSNNDTTEDSVSCSNWNKKKSECPVCGKIFPKTSNMKKHLNSIHYGIKDYRCNLCDKSYAAKDTLKYHMRSHIGKKEFECDICLQLLPNHNALKYHLNIHVGSDYEGNLAKPLKIGKPIQKDGIKYFECPKCHKLFTVKNYLYTHLKIHSLDDQIHADIDSPKDNNLPVENIEDIFVKEEHELDKNIVELSNNKYEEILIKEPEDVNYMDSEICNDQKENKNNES